MEAAFGLGAFFLIFMFFIAAISLGSIAFWVWALVDVLKREDWMFLTGDRLMWALIVGLGGVIGAIVYIIVGRPKAAPGP